MKLRALVVALALVCCAGAAAQDEDFDAMLKSMAGDEWAAHLAAFFTSTLFDPNASFEQALGQNLATLKAVQYPTPEEQWAQTALDEQNARVLQENAVQAENLVKAQGQGLRAAYEQEAGSLLGPGFEGLDTPTMTFHKTAGLMLQDAHVGQLLQLRGQLNLVKPGTGTVSDGSFVGMSPIESTHRLSALNDKIGRLRAESPNDPQIAALENERAQLLKIDGVADNDALTSVRVDLIDTLVPLSQDVSAKQGALQATEAAYNQYRIAEDQLYNLEARGPAPALDPDLAQGNFQAWEADKARWQNILKNPVTQADVDRAQQAYFNALDKSPLLRAQVDAWGTGTPVPFWTFLATGQEQARQQAVLDQAIEFMDQATFAAIDQFGTIVDTQTLLTAYGSPAFGMLRAQVATELDGVYPGVRENMDAISSLHELYLADTELSRTLFSAGVGFVQIVIGGVIIIFPVTAPVLVPVELTLSGLELAEEGRRTYISWQETEQVRTADAAGVGVSSAVLDHYESLFTAQTGMFIFTAALTPIQARASLQSLAIANEIRAGRAAAKALEPETFKGLTPAQQATALAGQPDAVRVSLLGRLSPSDMEAFIEADFSRQLHAGSITNNGKIPNFGLSDDGLVVAHELPPPGYLTNHMTQAKIDALNAKSVLTNEEILQKIDLARVGRLGHEGWDDETRAAMVQEMRNHFRSVEGKDLTAPQLFRLIDGFGPSQPGKAAQPVGGVASSAPPPFIANAMGEFPARPWWQGGGPGVNPVPAGAVPNWLGDPVVVNTYLPSWLLQSPVPAPVPGSIALVDPNMTIVMPPNLPPLTVSGQTAFAGTTLAGRVPAAAPNAALADASTRVVANPANAIAAVAPPPGGFVVLLTPPPGAVVPALPSGLNPFVIKAFTIGATQVFVFDAPENQQKELATRIADNTGAVADVNSERNKQETPNDPFFGSRGSWGQARDDQWAIKRVGFTSGADSAWNRARPGGAPTIVAVIDTGVAWNHPDLDASSLWINEDEIPGNLEDDDRNGYIDDVVGWNFIDDTNIPWDFDGHGTMVAGIVAADRDNGIGIAGIDPNARIMVLKALNNSGRSRASYLAEAITYAANNGARIVNLSVGGRSLAKVERLAVQYAQSRGALVIAAAGNEAIDLRDYGPAGIPELLTVAATGPEDKRIDFSNWGGEVDVAAPGWEVLGLRAAGTDLMVSAGHEDYRRGDNVVGAERLYFQASGTSFSAPIVAGLASLVWSARPQLSADQVRRIVEQSAEDIEAPGRDPLTGYGLIDARAALAADPDFFIEAHIAGARVQTSGGRAFVEVLGSAAADRFAGARVEIGAGEEPASWKTAIERIRAPVEDAVLGRIPAEALSGAPVWMLRVIAAHENGRTREARYRLKLN